MELKDFKISSDSKESLLIPEGIPREASKPSFFSRLFFTWIYPVLLIDPTTKLTNEDTLPLFASEQVIHEQLTKNLNKSHLFFSIVRANLRSIVTTFFFNFLRILAMFKNPIFMKLLLDYLNSDEKPLDYGIFLAASFTLASILDPIIQTQIEFQMEMREIRVRNSLYNVIYNKTLGSTSLSEGMGVNLIEIDTETVKVFFRWLPLIPLIPLEIVIGTIIVYQQVGSAVFLVYGLVFTAMIGNIVFGTTCKRTNEEIMKFRDRRIEESTQLLTEMKMIKAYNWQNYFSDRINSIRHAELRKIRFLNVLNAANAFYFWALPSIIFICVMLFYTQVMDQTLTSEKAFVTLSTIYNLAIPFLLLPAIAIDFFKVTVSLGRIQKLIDVKPWQQLPNSNQISMKNCSFAYDSKVVLKDLTLEIHPSEFIAVIGPVGCGKSSLLLSLMGETQLTSGEFLANTDLSYAPSLDSWVINGSLRENILMGREFREEWYWKVVEACSLLDDLQALASGDATEIGERGINLSGGQKARVCLARAVYSDKQIILMDDPLSSVDNQVANSIFSKCFQQLLKDKIRVLVTHRHSYLDRVDRILKMKEGKIEKDIACKERGALLQNEIIELIQYDEADDKSKNESKAIDEQSKQVGVEKKVDGAKNSQIANSLVEEEDRNIGKVDREVYKRFISWGGGFWIFFIGASFIFWSVFIEIMAGIALEQWSSKPQDSSFYLPLYVTLRITASMFMFIRFIIFEVIILIKAS